MRRLNKKGANWSLILSGFVMFSVVMFAGAGIIGDMGTTSFAVSASLSPPGSAAPVWPVRG